LIIRKPILRSFSNPKKKPAAWDDKFRKAKEEEAKRKAEIEENFKHAKDIDLNSENEPFKSPFDWD